MSITAHTGVEDDTSAKMRFPILASPLAALLYPFVCCCSIFLRISRRDRHRKRAVSAIGCFSLTLLASSNRASPTTACRSCGLAGPRYRFRSSRFPCDRCPGSSTPTGRRPFPAQTSPTLVNDPTFGACTLTYPTKKRRPCFANSAAEATATRSRPAS